MRTNLRSTRQMSRLLGVLTAAAVAVGVAAPPVAASGSSSGPAEQASARTGVPEIHPVPQQVSGDGAPVPLAGRVTLVVGEDPDPAAIAAVEGIVADAGGNPVVSKASRGRGKEIYLGTVGTNPAVSDVLAALEVENATDLPDEGYVLASGRYQDRPVVVLNGADGAGTFYAAQTLRQVVVGQLVPGVRVRDWPLMSIRGAIEGFYGIPWSHQARLDHMAFYGRHKMNTYIYTPKDDPLLRERWRELYSGADLARLEELVDAANANHVKFTFALSPGNDICYSSQADFEATIAKFEQLRELGVSSFYIALDDIPLRFHCDADREKYPNEGNWHWLADAQVDYLNRIQTEYVEPNGLAPLQTVPTNYAGSAEDPYKGRFGDRLDEDVRVQWTGEGVFSDQITTESVRRASQTYRTDHLFIWDNFPVNDGRRSRLFLNPLTGRDPELYKYIDGITSNPMIQPYASLPALANYGDYSWNGPDYDPNRSMAAVLEELAGDDPAVWAALEAFADLNQSWPYRPEVVRAPELSRDVEAFWTAYQSGDPAGMEQLEQRLATIAALPTSLADMAEPGFYADAEPWIDAAAQWATALRHEIDMLTAIRADDGNAATNALFEARAWIEKTKRPTVDDQGGDGVVHEDALVPSVGDGVFEKFSDRAMDRYADWLGVTEREPAPAYPATASSSMGAYADHTVDNMVDGDVSTLYWSNEAGRAGDWVQVDLGQVREVGSVAVHQSDSDTISGDMFYNAVLQYSVDGTTWTDAGTFSSTPLAAYTFDTPVQARYVRLKATADNTGGQWVKVREFAVSPPTGHYASDLPNVSGQGPALAFDGDVGTAFTAATDPAEGSHLASTFDESRAVDSVAVVGTASGSIQIHRGDAWVTVGSLEPGSRYHQAPVNLDDVTGVRLVFAPGSQAPQIAEVALRESD